MDRQSKQQQIFDTALQVFAQYGFRQATMEQVAGKLGMTKSSLYFYCSGKEDLYNQAVAHALLQWQAHVRAAVEAEADVVQKLVTLAVQSNAYLAENDDLRTILINDPQIQSITPTEDRYPNIGAASHGMLRQLLVQGMAEGKFKPGDVDHLADFLYSIHCMFVVKTYVKGEGRSAQEIYRRGIELILQGLLAK